MEYLQDLLQLYSNKWWKILIVLIFLFIILCLIDCWLLGYKNKKPSRYYIIPAFMNTLKASLLPLLSGVVLFGLTTLAFSGNLAGVNVRAQQYSDALVYMEQQNYDAALPILRTLHEQKPEDGDCAYILAQALYYTDVNSEVVAELMQSAIASCRDEEEKAERYAFLGKVYHYANEPEDHELLAKDSYMSAWELVPTDGNLSYLAEAALCLSWAGNNEEAAEVLSAVLEHDIPDPDDRVGYLNAYAKILFELGQFSHARAVIDEAMRIVPDKHFSRYLSGRLYLEEGELEKARRDFYYAKDDGNATWTEYYKLTDNLLRQEEDPSDPSLYNDAGCQYFYLGLYPQATEQFRLALEHDSSDTVYLSNLAYVLYQQEEYTEAGELYRQLSMLEPEESYNADMVQVCECAETLWDNDSYDTRMALGEAYLALVRNSERSRSSEIAYLKEALTNLMVAQMLCDCTECHFALGRCYYELEDYAAALDEFDFVLSKEGDNYDNVRYWWEIAFYKSELAEDPNNAALYNSEGLVWMEHENYDAALSCFRQAAELVPDNSAYTENMQSAAAHLDVAE